MRILYENKKIVVRCPVCDTVVELVTGEFELDYTEYFQTPSNTWESWSEPVYIDCPSCHETLHKDGIIKTPTKFSMIENSCEHCGTDYGHKDNHCPSCGAPIKRKQRDQNGN